MLEASLLITYSLSQYVVDLLKSKADMLKDYFSLEITQVSYRNHSIPCDCAVVVLLGWTHQESTHLASITLTQLGLPPRLPASFGYRGLLSVHRVKLYGNFYSWGLLGGCLDWDS